VQAKGFRRLPYQWRSVLTLQISVESISNVRYTATRNVQGPLHIAYSSTA
jgi:hypothetical protein